MKFFHGKMNYYIAQENERKIFIGNTNVSSACFQTLLQHEKKFNMENICKKWKAVLSNLNFLNIFFIHKDFFKLILDLETKFKIVALNSETLFSDAS